MMKMRKSERRGAAGKRRRRAGEALVETLVTVLIVGLSSVLFLTMVGASTRVFNAAEEEYKEVYEKITSADMRKNVVTGKGKIVVEGSSSVEVGVTWYGETWYGDKDYVLSYEAG